MLREIQGSPASGPIFPKEQARRADIGNVTNREILPVLRQHNIKWHVWHAFRRGLATNLNHLGVPHKTIQAILRHRNVTTTQNIYIKTVSEDA